MIDTEFEKYFNGIINLICAPSERVRFVFGKNNIPTNFSKAYGLNIILDGYRDFKKAQDLIMEALLKVEKELKLFIDSGDIPSRFSLSYLHYQRHVFKSLANSIIWLVIPDNTAVLNLFGSLDAHHGYLEDRNIDSVKNVADDLNKEKSCLAIISDLTSVVGIGDLVVIRASSSGGLNVQIIEVKTGKVSEKITNIFSNSETENSLQANIKSFLSEFPKYGLKQLKRFMRQTEKTHNYLTLINKGKGKDPISGKPKQIIELKTEDERISGELNDFLDVFYSQDKRDMALIDTDCLTLGIFKRRAEKLNDISSRLDFKHYLYHRDPNMGWEKCIYNGTPDKQEFDKEFSAYQKIEIKDIRYTVSLPLILPLLISGLKKKYVMDILLGKLSIYTYLNEDRFLKILTDNNIKYEFTNKTSDGEIREELFEIKGKFIKLFMDDKVEFMLYIRPMMRILYEFKSLQSTINQFKEHISSMHNIKTGF